MVGGGFLPHRELQKRALADPCAPSNGAPLRPTTAAPAAATIAMMLSMLALRIASLARNTWPPVIWPVS